MKKIVLIIPPSPWLISDTDIPSLGILYISSYLKANGFEVDVVDLTGTPAEAWKFPVGDCYGITCTTPHFYIVKDIIEMLKARDSGALVIVGGPHPTALPEQTLRDTKADICVIGEGEQAIEELMNGYEYLSVPNIAYFEHGKFKKSFTHLIGDIDIIPYPDRDAIDIYKYLPSRTYSYLMGEVKETILYTGRGCPYNCSFCASKTMHGGKVRFHSIPYIVGEIELLKKKYGVELFYFDDDTLVIDKKRMSNLCDAIKPLDIKWNCLNRVDCCDAEVVKKMKGAGCIGMVIGFESGSNKILEINNKRTTVQQAYDCIDILKENDIHVRAQMVVGLPGEDWDTIIETGKFIYNAKEKGVDKFGIHVFQPFPGCPVWNNPDDFGYSLDKDNIDFNMHTIGKPDERLKVNDDVLRWHNYLKGVAGHTAKFN